MKIIAVCSEERGCPLYRRDSRLEFTPPSVAGQDGAEVCAVAVEALQKVIPRIQSGQVASAFARTYCGGCPAGKAWWDFEVAARETSETKSGGVSQFILSRISQMSLFSGVHTAKLMQIVKLIKGTRVPNGTAVITKGRPGEAFYIVLEGACEVVQEEEEGHVSSLATLPAGECFGEMSLITGEPASATVRAKGDSTVLVISKDNFEAMLALAPEVAITLARILAHRLANTGRKVVEELRKGLTGRLDLISPSELIQAMNVNNQTGMLIVQNEDQDLKIYLHDGQVHEVELGDTRGDEAFFEFLRWAKGHFRFEPVRKDDTVRRVRMDTMGLLMEGMRRVDEFRQTGAWRKDDPPAP